MYFIFMGIEIDIKRFAKHFLLANEHKNQTIKNEILGSGYRKIVITENVSLVKFSKTPFLEVYIFLENTENKEIVNHLQN